jgi:hypothetical protein
MRSRRPAVRVHPTPPIGPTDRPKDSSTRQAYGESDPTGDAIPILTGLRAVILSRPWRAHSQLIGTLPADGPVAGLRLDLATARAGRFAIYWCSTRAVRRARSSLSVRPARRGWSVARVSSQLSVSARVCSSGRVVSPTRRALLLSRALKPSHSGSTSQSGRDRSPSRVVRQGRADISIR